MNLDDLLNIREAAEMTGLSEMTIRKHLGLGKPPQKTILPNARKAIRAGDTKETWAIPVSDLHNAGLMKGSATNTAKAQVEEAAGELFGRITEANERIKLDKENFTLKLQLSAAERENELLRANLADLRLLLGRAIETAETQETRKRRFWQR